MQELPKAYDPKETEDRIYKMWLESKSFQPVTDFEPEKKSQEPFVIVIPPPNVTGSLHMGHALNNTIQDILIRRSRMKGVPTLWIPGTDHAGIATQNVVEKQLAKEGTNRHELGREKFIEKVWEWKEKYGSTIIDQLKKMGCSCDWSRERFTMDEDYSEAVKTAFNQYKEKGWIYQGERVINWCVRCQTALSDIELEYKETEGNLWFIKYPIKDSDEFITVATTRPETMLGDTAVAVHPDDKRWQKFIGKTAIVPIINREVPIIADKVVDKEFGTGAVKVTPAHDMNDAEIGERHKLPAIKVINELGKITDEAPEFSGQKALEARETIVNKLSNEKLLEKTEKIIHQVPHCYRCGRPVEQLTSKQWFVKMDELIKPAIKAIESGEIKIVPERWTKVYLDWMKNIRDWCISRQIWWGHKIPIEGTEDVLDTWFSSALWPFATLGWPKETEDLKYFYPTTVLSTARDINMLWVVRMIFSGLEFMKEKPFSTVYVHPTVFNIEGKRMSKSLGTGVDPLELIEKYGTDATRFGLTYINTGTQDIKFDEDAILAGKKFANKFWNVARFILLQKPDRISEKFEAKTDADKKILERLEEIKKSTDENLDKFRFGQTAHDLYDFIWHDLADVYIETAKNQEDKENTFAILAEILITTLRLLHPVMPFITEEIWQHLKEAGLVKEEKLITAAWPTHD